MIRDKFKKFKKLQRPYYYQKPPLQVEPHEEQPFHYYDSYIVKINSSSLSEKMELLLQTAANVICK